MDTAKKTEVYKMAFDLAIRVYRLNMALPANRLVKEGHRLRRSSVRVKDALSEVIATGLSGEQKGAGNIAGLLILAHTSCNETLLQLKQIQGIPWIETAVAEVITGYTILSRKIGRLMQEQEHGKKALTLPFPSLQKPAKQVAIQ